MGVTIEQYEQNGRPIWVHVSTRRATRRGRTFLGSITVDPAAAVVKLSIRQVHSLTGIKPPPISEEHTWQEIFQRLGQIDPATFAQYTAPPPTIPRTSMRSLFEQCRTHTSLDAQASWARQLTPTALARAFTTSIEEFTPYRNTEPFYPANRPTLPVPDSSQPVRSSRDLAILLKAQGTAEVINDPCLKFRYVDYEVVPARTTGGASYTDGKKGTTWVRLDQLLLATQPIIAEVKLRHDKNPFYALVQALTAAAELLTPAQRERLRQHYPQLIETANDATVYIYVIAYRTDENGPTWHDLHKSTEYMCRELSKMSAVTQHIAQFAILELQDPVNGIVSFQRVFRT